jgi:hypothetical protein
MDANFRIVEVVHRKAVPDYIPIMPGVFVFGVAYKDTRFIFKVYGNRQAQREAIVKAVQSLVDDPSLEFDAVDAKVVLRDLLWSK